MRAQRKAEALHAQTPENSFEIVYLQFKIHVVCLCLQKQRPVKVNLEAIHLHNTRIHVQILHSSVNTRSHNPPLSRFKTKLFMSKTLYDRYSRNTNRLLNSRCHGDPRNLL